MTKINTVSSGKKANGSLSASVKKRQVTYISDRDPRALDKNYIKNFPGTLEILPYSQFLAWLKSEEATGSGAVLNDSEDNTSYGILDTSIGIPGQPVWDTSALKAITTDTGVYFDGKVVFDLSPLDPNDGTYQYYVHYEQGTLTPSGTNSTTSPTPATPGVTPPTNSGTSSKNPVGTISYSSHSSSNIEIFWKALSNVSSYSIKVTGNNLPGTSGQSTKTYTVSSSGTTTANYTGGKNTNGNYLFILKAVAGKAFSGTYNFTVTAVYSAGSSAGVSKSVPIA